MRGARNSSDCVPLKEHFEALRANDQRALELLAKANADRIKHGALVASIMVSIASVLVAITAILWKH